MEHDEVVGAVRHAGLCLRLLCRGQCSSVRTDVTFTGAEAGKRVAPLAPQGLHVVLRIRGRGCLRRIR
jgi:hypothetical protein